MGSKPRHFGKEYIPSDDDNDYEEVEYEYDDMLDMPDYCRGCNPAYPECQDGCRIYEGLN